jgi:phosphate transport system permease protein
VSVKVRLTGRRPVIPRAPRRGASASNRADWLLHALCGLAVLLMLAVMLEIAYQVFSGAGSAFSKFGFGFMLHGAWEPNFGVFGATVLIFGTVVSSAMALLIATPLGIAIAFYLAMLAPGRVRAAIGPLVEMLAAIPSVIVGFWGILVLSPFIQKHLEPGLHSALGFIPLFGAPQTVGSSVFTAGLVLTIMILPIIASLSRDLFLTVPRELLEGAEALGATRWETVRGVVLPTTAPGVTAAALLGLGRALGEAIAVTQVIGAGNAIHGSLFATGDTIASRIADQFSGAEGLYQSSMFYLAAILLVIGLVTNLVAQRISRRFTHQFTIAR